MNITQLLNLVLAQPVSDSTIQEGVAFTKLFMRYESLMITSASWVIVQVVRKVAKGFAESSIGTRVMPALAVVLSIGMAYMPTFRLGAWDETLLYGIVLGSLTGLGHKILKQTIFGKESGIQSLINDPELKKKVDEHLAARQAQRQRIREKVKHLLT